MFIFLSFWLLYLSFFLSLFLSFFLSVVSFFRSVILTISLSFFLLPLFLSLFEATFCSFLYLSISFECQLLVGECRVSVFPPSFLYLSLSLSLSPLSLSFSLNHPHSTFRYCVENNVTINWIKVPCNISSISSAFNNDQRGQFFTLKFLFFSIEDSLSVYSANNCVLRRRKIFKRINFFGKKN